MTRTERAEFGRLFTALSDAGWDAVGATTFGVLYEGVRLGMLPATPSQHQQLARAAIQTGYLADRAASIAGAADIPAGYSRNAHDLLFLAQSDPDDFTEQERVAEGHNMLKILAVHAERLASRERRLVETREALSDNGTKAKFIGWTLLVPTVAAALSAAPTIVGLNATAASMWGGTMTYLVMQLATFHMYRGGKMRATGIMELAQAAEREVDRQLAAQRTLIEDGWTADQTEDTHQQVTGRSIALHVARTSRAQHVGKDAEPTLQRERSFRII